jgi:hypothetical protein
MAIVREGRKKGANGKTKWGKVATEEGVPKRQPLAVRNALVYSILDGVV